MRDWLMLVPTPLEQQYLAPKLIDLTSQQGRLERCGFGPVVAAARTASLIAQHRPKWVVLIGIAGGYDSNRPPGEAVCFGSVACHGIGVGQEPDFRSAQALGWPQWPESPPIGDSLALKCPSSHSQPMLLSVCAASASPTEAQMRRERYPMAVAEDMEGFAVAAACQLASVPLTIVRGISNRAGERDHANWRILAAMDSASELACRLLSL
jgi:futalosine hydrolase